MSIYVTGDCHSSFSRFSTKAFPQQKGMDREKDFVIVCGDLALIWDQEETSFERYWMDWFEKKPFTTLFVDGNHENHPRLSAYPVRDFAGGRVHELRPHLLHLMRGEMYRICGKRIFTFGGARSHDIDDGVLDPVEDAARIRRWRGDGEHDFRVMGVSWWPQEMPSEEEMAHGLRILEAAGWETDYFVTHEAPSSIRKILQEEGIPKRAGKSPAGISSGEELCAYLETIRSRCRYRKWFFGHLHDERQAGEREYLLYHSIIPAEDGEPGGE